MSACQTSAVWTNSAFEAVLLTFCRSSKQFIWQARKPQMRPIIWVSGPLSQQEMLLPWLPDRLCVCVCERSSDGAMWITDFFFFPLNLDLSLHFAELALWFSLLHCFIHIHFTLFKELPVQPYFSTVGNYSSLWVVRGAMPCSKTLSSMLPAQIWQDYPRQNRLSNWLPYSENVASMLELQVYSPAEGLAALKQKIWRAAKMCGALCFGEWSYKALDANAAYWKSSSVVCSLVPCKSVAYIF